MSKLKELLSNQHWMIHDLIDGDQIENDEEEQLYILKDDAIEEFNEMVKFLNKISIWFGEFPKTGKFHKSGKPTSYAYEYGSNGERDYMRSLAMNLLKKYNL